MHSGAQPSSWPNFSPMYSKNADHIIIVYIDTPTSEAYLHPPHQLPAIDRITSEFPNKTFKAQNSSIDEENIFSSSVVNMVEMSV